jgi:hypothetical protein
MQIARQKYAREYTCNHDVVEVIDKLHLKGAGERVTVLHCSGCKDGAMNLQQLLLPLQLLR